MTDLKSRLKQTRQLVRETYIEPLRDASRAKVILVGSLSNFGFGALSFTLNYDMASTYMSSLTYQIVRMLLMGLVAVPFSFFVMTRLQSRLLLSLFQLSGIALFFIDRTNALYNAIGIAIVFGPFLANYNYGFSKNMSKQNGGNEMALNSYLVVIAYSLGLFIGGYMLEHGLYFESLVLSSLMLVVGTFFLYRPVVGRNNWRKIKSLISWRKPSSRITFLVGLFNPMADGCMPIWMRQIGISAMGAGINMSLRPLFGFILTPVVGWLIQKKGFRAGQLGGTAMIFGWIFIALSHNFPWLLSFAMALLMTGTSLITPMEAARWFKRRSSAAVISREMLISTGRANGQFLGITTSFLMPLAYPLMGLALSAAFIFGTMTRRKGFARTPKEVPTSA